MPSESAPDLNVDLLDHQNSSVPPASPVPSPPPPPPPPPHVKGATEAQVTVKYNTPLNSAIPGVRTAPGLTRKDSSVVDYLNAMVNDPDAVMNTMSLTRTGPTVWQGEELMGGVIKSDLPPLTYAELYEAIKSQFGGGTYRVTVFDAERVPKRVFSVTIPTATCPPISNGVVPTPVASPWSRTPSAFTPPVNGFATGFTPGRFASPLNGGIQRPLGSAFEDDELLKLRAEERREHARIQLEEKKREAIRREREWRSQEEIEAERRENKMAQPMLLQMQNMEKMMQMQREAADKQLQAQRESSQQMMQMLMAMMAQPKGDNSIALLIESTKAQQQMMTSMVTALMGNQSAKAQEFAATTQSQIDAFKHMAEMSIKTAQGGNGKFDKIVETLITAQIQNPKNSVKDALELMELGRKQTLEILEMQGEKEDTEGFDPNLSTGQNVVKGIMGALKGLTSGNNPVGPMLMQGLMGLIGKRGQEPSEVDLATIARTLEVAQNRPQLPPVQAPMGPPPGMPAFGPPTQRVVQVPPRPTPQPVVQPVPQPIVPIQVNPQPPVVPNMILEVMEDVPEEPLVEEVNTPVAEVQKQMPVEPVAPAPAPVAVQAPVAVTENEYVSEAVNMAVEDIQSGRREHEWVEMAFDKWPKIILDEIVQAADDAVRLQVIRKYCAPGIWQRFESVMLDERYAFGYGKLIEGLRRLVIEHGAEHASIPTAVS